MTATRTTKARPVLFASPRHPELHVHDLAVAFVGGLLEVTDPAVADALRGLPADLGVVEVPEGADVDRYLTPSPAEPSQALAGSYQARLLAAKDAELAAADPDITTEGPFQ